MFLDDIKRAAWRKGRKQGLVEGRKEGEYLRQIEIARKLRRAKLDAEFIATVTGLSLREVEAL